MMSRPVLLTLQESLNPEDECRRFILSYFLSNDMISIYEKPTRNSGIIGGKFLEKTRIPKPNSTVQHPEYYSPADFAIGATVEGNMLSLCISALIPLITKRVVTQKLQCLI